jgi:hypothetical protein
VDTERFIKLLQTKFYKLFAIIVKYLLYKLFIVFNLFD